MWKLQALVLLSIVFTARHDDVHIAPSVSAGTVSPAPRPRADAWGYLDRQWIGFHHTLVGRRPIATGWSSSALMRRPLSKTSGVPSGRKADAPGAPVCARLNARQERRGERGAAT